ncbi:uncharacterized protein TRIADDRAFT_27098 [Trichoplax adhaerens]|uniref:Cytidine deaminase n=1 Tax=Trichoplax adhaerens TaxID=10228 RepID=B3RZD2_TRIAD|nr:hypothetical protein TRIADDRAFT_27098 [Trichoplax adhaerens]EDV24180.1 hypothetical protein TRIADDRAFT_27098 [Trichoplax adhaerens]|eukprot:XP_002113706.1 hypothetical protein TRIADDRAFT_27098 [Trichoplax adhaerens]
MEQFVSTLDEKAASQDSTSTALTDEDKEILRNCHLAKEFAYAPYSKFRVGSALLAENGKIYLGCNVENAAYGACICAERTAIVKAVSEGQKKFRSIAITADIQDQFCLPCGTCRQVLAEFSPDCVLYSVKPDNQYIRTTVKEILPHAFTPQHLSMNHQPRQVDTSSKFHKIETDSQLNEKE